MAKTKIFVNYIPWNNESDINIIDFLNANRNTYNITLFLFDAKECFLKKVPSGIEVISDGFYQRSSLKKHYDVAISFFSYYYSFSEDLVLNYVKADKKLAWIHTDYNAVDKNLDKFDGIIFSSKEHQLRIMKTNPDIYDKSFYVPDNKGMDGFKQVILFLTNPFMDRFEEIRREVKEESHIHHMKTYKNEYDECIDDVLLLVNRRISDLKKQHERAVSIANWQRRNNMEHTSPQEKELEFMIIALTALRGEIQNMREDNDLK